MRRAQSTGALESIEDWKEVGRGKYDPETGLHEWYDNPPERTAQAGGKGPGRSVDLWDVFTRWDLVVADLAAIHHIPPAQITEQPWPALRGLIFGLLNEPASRLRKNLGG